MSALLYIGYEDTLTYLNLTTVNFKELMKVMNINSIPEKFTKVQYDLFDSYLKRTGHDTLNVPEKIFFQGEAEQEKSVSLEELLRERKKKKNIPAKVIKEEQVEIIAPVQKTEKSKVVEKKKEIKPVSSNLKITKPITVKVEKQKEAKKEVKIKPIKEVKKNRVKIESIKKDSLDPAMIKISSSTKAIQTFKEGYKIYYRPKKTNTLLCMLDVRKSFNINMNLAPGARRLGQYEFYTKNEKYDISLQSKQSVDLYLENSGMEKIGNFSEARSLYNKGTIIYYRPKKMISAFCMVDLSKSFSENFTIFDMKPSKFYFYTKHESFDKTSIRNSSKQKVIKDTVLEDMGLEKVSRRDAVTIFTQENIVYYRPKNNYGPFGMLNLDMSFQKNADMLSEYNTLGTFAFYTKYESFNKKAEKKKSTKEVKETKQTDDIFLKDSGMEKLTSEKTARAAYNSGKIVYYRPKKQLSIVCMMDTTKSFYANMKIVRPDGKFGQYEYYTKNEPYELAGVIPQYKEGRKFTPEEDQKILEFYQKDDYASAKKDEDSITLNDLALEFKVDTKKIRNRAIELGFIKFKRPREEDWSDEEKDLLKRVAGKHPFTQLTKIFKNHGFTRSPIAIGIMLRRMELSKLLDGSGVLNLELLSKLMGVDGHFFYENDRIEKMNGYKENNQWNFEKYSIREYLIQNPLDYDLAKVDPEWFVGLLSEQPNKDFGDNDIFEATGDA